MPIINKLPIGGGASGIDGNATLNLYTQMNEPTKKDGIWVQTNHQYKKAIIDNNHIFDNTGTWTNAKNSGLQDEWFYIRGVYNGELYRMQFRYPGSIPLYKTNNVLQCIDNNTTVTWTQVGAFSLNGVSSLGTTYLYRAIVCNGKLYIAVAYNESYSNHGNVIFEYNASTNSCNIACKGTTVGGHDLFTYNNDLYEISTDDWGYVEILKIDTVSGSRTLIKNINYSNTRTYDYPNAICNNGYIFVSYYERSTTDTSDISYNSSIYKFNDNNELVYAGSISPVIRTQRMGLFFLYNNIPCIVYSDTDNGYDKYIYGIIKQNDGSSYYNAKLTKLISAPPDGDKISVIGKYLISNEGYVYTASANTYDPQTLIIQRNTSNNGTYKTGIYDLKSIVDESLQPLIEGDANRCLYGFDDCYYFADTAFDWNAPMYYGDGSQWIKFKN